MMITYLDQEKQTHFKERAFDLLSQRGVRIDHPAMLNRLEDAGASVNSETRIVRFPEAVLEPHIALAPREFALYGRGEREPLHLPTVEKAFITRTNTGAHAWIEPGSGTYRRVTVSDVANWGRLAEALEHIGFCGFPGPNDVPAETMDLHSYKTLLEHTSKHIWVQPYARESIDDLISLSIVAAGEESILRTKPPVSFIVCAFSPLVFKALDMDILTKSAKAGIPLQLCSAPVAGATAPITSQGIALMAVVEILAMVVISQVIEPGIPVIATPLIFSMEMRSGRSLHATPEALQGCALAGQFIKQEFGLPTHSYGAGTDSPALDAQSRHESAVNCMTMALSGIDILGGAGQLETATTISPLQLIADSELFGQVRGLLSDLKVDDETLAWEDLLAIEPGGDFLRTRLTRNRARHVGKSNLFTRLGRESWEREGREDLYERAQRLYEQILKTESPPILSKQQRSEMEAILKKADLRSSS
jgi:trimethylamine:corrinoid methyltransferase-like protein